MSVSVSQYSPPPPPPGECTPIGQFFLVKVGLTADANAWLVGQGNVTHLGTYAYFQCSPTRSLILEHWRADVMIDGVLERKTIYEVPNVLLYSAPDQAYKLLTKLQYSTGGGTGVNVGEWLENESLPIGIWANEYNWDIENENQLGVICWAYQPVLPPAPQPPPHPEPVEPPHPSIGENITTFDPSCSGQLHFSHWEPGTVRFHAIFYWNGSSVINVRFPVPPELCGHTFAVSGWTYSGSFSGVVTPDPENPHKLLLTCPLTPSQQTSGNYYFSAYGIDITR